jgi:hypothetical protein
MRKFAEEFNGFPVICSCSIKSTIFRKQSDMNLFPFDVNIATPFMRGTMPKNSLVSRFVIFGYFLISAILHVIARSEILASIIQTVSVFVIYIALALQNKAVHKNNTIFTGRKMFYVSNINILGLFGWNSKPVVLTNQREIFCVNDGIVAARKRNQFNRLINRLNNCVTGYYSFHKTFLSFLQKFVMLPSINFWEVTQCPS